MTVTYNYKLISLYRTQLMGIAIFWITLFHSTVDLSFLPPLAYIKALGYGGVDIFLFLSGLGLYMASLKNNNLCNFYKRRFMRIVPTYLPIALLYYIFIWLQQGISPISMILNILSLGFWFNTESHVYWYVSAIIALYLITPGLLFLFKRVSKPVFIISIIVAALILSYSISSGSFSYLLIFTTRIPIFCVGILTGYFININKKESTVNMIIAVAVFFIGATLLFISIKIFNNLLWTYGLWWYPFILITLPLCIFLSSIIHWLKNSLGFDSKVLTFFGTHSFEIYLIHVRIIPIAKFFLLTQFDRFGIIFNLICLATTLLLAFVWRRFVVCLTSYTTQLHYDSSNIA